MYKQQIIEIQNHYLPMDVPYNEQPDTYCPLIIEGVLYLVDSTEFSLYGTNNPGNNNGTTRYPKIKEKDEIAKERKKKNDKKSDLEKAVDNVIGATIGTIVALIGNSK